MEVPVTDTVQRPPDKAATPPPVLVVIFQSDFFVLKAKFKTIFEGQPVSRELLSPQAPRVILLLEECLHPLISSSKLKGLKCHDPSHPCAFSWLTIRLKTSGRKPFSKLQFCEGKHDLGQVIPKSSITNMNRCCKLGKECKPRRRENTLPHWHFIRKALSELKSPVHLLHKQHFDMI